MRIARVLTRLNLGGPARQVLASDPLLGERGHDVRIFTGSPEAGEGELFDAAKERGLDVVRVPGLKRAVAPLSDWRARRSLSKLLRSFDPDVLHTHASKAGTLGRVAVRGNDKVARVHTYHGHVLKHYFPDAMSRLLVAHETKLAAETDRVVAVSHATAEDLLELGIVPEEKLVVVPPGIEIEPFLAIQRQERVGELRRLCAAEAGDLLVGVVGRLAAVKRIELSVEVFASLAPRYPRAHLVFVGDGSERRRLEQRISELDPDIARRTHLLGARSDMVEVLSELNVLLLTSKSEGMPVSLIEAAAAGLPVVATPVGGVPELVVHERTGFLGADATELAFHLSTLLEDDKLRAEMGRRARLRVASRHSAAALAQRLEELYEVVAEERTCAS